VKRLLFLLLLLSPAVAITESRSIDYFGYNNILIEHYSSAAKLTRVEQEVYLYPIDGIIISQVLTNLTLTNGYLSYVHEGDFDASGWSFNIQFNNNRTISMIKENPSFPYPQASLPSNVIRYLDYGEYVDTNDALRAKADEIITGVSDYLTAVQLISEWVHDNINYTFAEPFNSTTLKASQVLSLGMGVCDEFTVLFMSLARAVGIPCRYVIGYSYGNVIGINGFGRHAWVEVYVPSHGWISTDPTYGQHGWTDDTHIVLYKSWNMSSNFISTSTQGYHINDINLINDLPDYLRAGFGIESDGFTVLSTINESIVLSATASLSKSVLAEREYFYLNISVTNPYDYYIPLSFDITTTRQMEFINDSRNHYLLLAPLSITNSYVLMRTPVIGAHVNHPMSISIPMAEELLLDVEVDNQLIPTSSLSELLLLTNLVRVYNKDLFLTNLLVQPEVVYGDVALLNVSLKNSGNQVINDAVITVYSDLINTALANVSRLGINEAISVNVPLSIISRGSDDLRLYVNYNNSTLTASVPFAAPVTPDINLFFEGNQSFNDNPDFVIKIDNYQGINVPLLNLTISTPRESLTKTFSPGSIYSYVVDTQFPKSWLNFGDNVINFTAIYFDDYGTPFSAQLSVNLERTGSIWDKIVDFFIRLFENIL
jgi:transglutaminase-like putative cysteine protease